MNADFSIFRKTNFVSNALGYTLIELMLGLGVAASLATIAAPSFATMINSSRVHTETSSLRQSLLHARNHALTSGVIVILCPTLSKGSNRCLPNHSRYNNWGEGWLSYADLNKNNQLDEHDEILNIYEEDNNVAVVFNQTGRLRFFPNGSARSAGFYICHAQTDKVAYIRLLHTGRTRTSTKLNGKKRSICMSKATSA